MPTLKQKVEKYEQLLHYIQACHDVIMDYDRLGQLIRNICDWSYAHRRGNGTLTQRQQNKLINEAFNHLTDTFKGIQPKRSD
jgi:hypothetical protein